MEEALRDSLLLAGERLAEAVRKGLQARGLPTDVSLQADGLRVSVVSRSRDVYKAEHGTSAAPPTAPFEQAVRGATKDVVRVFARSLEMSAHERGV